MIYMKRLITTAALSLALLSISPMAQGRSFVAWAGGLDLRDCRLSPIYGPLGNLDNVYLFVGTREIFYPDVVKFHGMLEEDSTM